jgi:ABC-type glycerol-3-phosphate transport system substrate-binding protein
MKRIFIAVVVAYALLSAGCGSTAPSASQNSGGAGDDGQIARAFENKTSDVQVEGEGVVTKILSDDLSGSRHQRFIVSLASGQTILIVHNVDLAERVDGLQTGDSVRFYGEYVWNEQGGKVHWTHHDPQGRHVAGWLKHNGRTYQ